MTSFPKNSLYRHQIKALLEVYQKAETQILFKDLAEITKLKCEEVLSRMRIKGLVQSRAKKYDSLETKLNCMAETAEFQEWAAGMDGGFDEQLPKDLFQTADQVRSRISWLRGPGVGVSDGTGSGHEGSHDMDKRATQASGDSNKQERDIYEHPDIGDFAGVRIGLFFPGDIAKVAQAINEAFHISYTFGTVTDTTRNAAADRNLDIQRHGDGRWISRDADGAVHHWEHYGYKSWQVVVEWNRPPPSDVAAIEAALAKANQAFAPSRIEIQVGTVVSQAWAEVQHNIIYKSPGDIQATPTMKRMIDAINGLAITTDIMLTELERSQAQAQKEAEAKRAREKRMPEIMLFKAASDGDDAAVKRLLKQGVSVNAKNGGNQTALHLASLTGQEKVVELLLAHPEVDVNARGNSSRTPLQCAIEKGHSKVVQRFVDDPRVDMNATGARGETPLHCASISGHAGVVQLLLARDDVDVNARDTLYGKTALYRSSELGHHAVVQQLLARDGVEVNAMEEGRNTVLHYAAEVGDEQLVEVLLAKEGLDVNVRDLMYGATALHWASLNGHYKIVQRLLSSSGVETNALDVGRMTPLSLACHKGHEMVVALLLASDGVDVHLGNNLGQTALHVAAENGHSETVNLLVQGGADVNLMTRLLRTPLQLASARGHSDVVKILLAQDGINVDGTDVDGRTALSWASANGHGEVVKLLQAAMQPQAMIV